MSKRVFSHYGERAQSALSETEVAGRYKIQKEAECRIVREVSEKLALSPKDDLLEIGCGSGQLLIPISFMVRSVKGIDHKEMIRRLRERFGELGEQLVEGDFMETEFTERSFDKVLVYSVLHCLENLESAKIFSKKALDLVKPGGILLLGDIPNADLKSRFENSSEGRSFCDNWKRNLERDGNICSIKGVREEILFKPDDKSIANLLKSLNTADTTSFLLPQDKDLPFGNTRVDIIVKKHK